MKDYLNKIFIGDKILWGIIFFLFIMSGVEMFSAISFSAYHAAAKGGSHLTPFYNHLSHLAGGAIALIIIPRVPFKDLRFWCFLAVIFCFILLIATMLSGKNVNSATRAISIGGTAIQTIEFGKFALIACLAEFLGRNYKKGDPLLKESFPRRAFIGVCIFITIFCGIIAPQNLSTACILAFVSLLMMIIAEVDLKKIAAFIGIIFALVFLIWGVHKFIIPEKYKLVRFVTWENRIIEILDSSSSEEDTYKITDENRQIINSEIAIALGYNACGPGNSTQRDHLPLAFSDFIYAIIIEEWGIVGGFVTILLYLCILARAGRVVLKCERKDLVYALLVIGLSLLIVVQAFVNMSVAVHLGPVTGQQLPIISRGGIGIILTCAYLGIIQNISHNILYVENKENSVNTIENKNNDQ